MLLVFVEFLIIGMAMPVLPLHVLGDLSLGPAAVGTVAPLMSPGVQLPLKKYIVLTLDDHGRRSITD